jgi:DNA polymerase III subunit alpha
MDGGMLDQTAMGLRIFFGDGFRPENAMAVLDQGRAGAKGRARGPVYLCALLGDLGEADLLIDPAFPVTPQVKGAFRSLPGVIEVEEI